jgi:DNA polymerase-1
MRDTMSRQIAVGPQQSNKVTTAGSLVEHVHKLQYALLRTEVEGVRVDLEYLAKLGVDLKGKIERLKPELRKQAEDYVELVELELWQKAMAKYKTDKGKQKCPRPEFSFNSATQLKSLLYTHMGLPVQRNEKTKEISTDFDSLEKIKHLHPVVHMIQEYREAEKIQGTYVDGILERVRGERIYPTFRLADDESGMKTSRISHRNPNLGNFPKGGGLKGMFIPEEGELFSDHDYGQLEVCIQAHYTQDKNLLDIVLNNASMHDITATALKIPRDMAKTVNFAMQYRCGPDKVAKIMNVSKAEGNLIFNKYWDTYSGVKRFLAEVDKKVWAGEPVSDLFGRKRRFPVRPGWEGDKMFRQAANFIIQSTGGQLMNNSFYKADELLRGRKTGRGLWTVHDSGLFSHRADLVAEQAREIDEIMLSEGKLVGLLVPLKVDSSVGLSRWGMDG